MFISKRKQKRFYLDIRTPKGFTSFYEKYVKYVYSICYHHLEAKNHSHDITSKIFESLWERRESLHRESLADDRSWRNYLSKTAKHKIYDHLKSEERTECFISSTTIECSHSEETTENEVVFTELNEQVSLLIEELPPKCKEVFELSRVEGLSKKEISARLSVSENTVKSHMAKALNHLRERLTDYHVPKRVTGT